MATVVQPDLSLSAEPTSEQQRALLDELLSLAGFLTETYAAQGGAEAVIRDRYGDHLDER